jgi:hypothetical protein
MGSSAPSSLGRRRSKLERFFEGLRETSDYDFSKGAEPPPLEPAVLFAASRRGRDLARVILSALGDDAVPTAELDRAVGRRYA